jgi:TFIIS helical bundle-like domain
MFATKCFPAGGVDLLLHLLSNIVSLPVTKSNVKDSGMGKAIGSIEKHKMCVGTANEASIKERVVSVKSAWQKSVKSLKEKNSSVETSSELESQSMGSSSKREIDASSKIDLAPSAKKARTDDKKKSSSLLSLLNKVKPDSDPSKKSMAESEVNSSSETKAKVPGGGHDGRSPFALFKYHGAHPNLSLQCRC